MPAGPGPALVSQAEGMQARPAAAQAATWARTEAGSVAPKPPSRVVRPARCMRAYSAVKLAGGTTGSTQPLMTKRSSVKAAATVGGAAESASASAAAGNDGIFGAHLG